MCEAYELWEASQCTPTPLLLVTPIPACGDGPMVMQVGDD